MADNDGGYIDIRIPWSLLGSVGSGGGLLGAGIVYAITATQPAACSNHEIDSVRAEVQATRELWTEKLDNLSKRIERIEK